MEAKDNNSEVIEDRGRHQDEDYHILVKNMCKVFQQLRKTRQNDDHAPQAE
jgi:hypothetical protein